MSRLFTIKFPQIILYTGYCLITNVLLFYSDLYIIAKHQLTTTYLLYTIAFEFCLMLIFITPIYYSVKCVDEIKMSSTLVNEMLDLYEDEKIYKSIVTFSRKILHRDRVISTIFFDVDWKLLFTVN
jgi:hypothetical protein